MQIWRNVTTRMYSFRMISVCTSEAISQDATRFVRMYCASRGAFQERLAWAHSQSLRNHALCPMLEFQLLGAAVERHSCIQRIMFGGISSWLYSGLFKTSFIKATECIRKPLRLFASRPGQPFFNSWPQRSASKRQTGAGTPRSTYMGTGLEASCQKNCGTRHSTSSNVIDNVPVGSCALDGVRIPFSGSGNSCKIIFCE